MDGLRSRCSIADDYVDSLFSKGDLKIRIELQDCAGFVFHYPRHIDIQVDIAAPHGIIRARAEQIDIRVLAEMLARKITNNRFGVFNKAHGSSIVAQS